MNPIKHVWDALGRRVAGRKPPPQTLQELERALLEDQYEENASTNLDCVRIGSVTENLGVSLQSHVLGPK
ncbi:hypothetical protein TNCV_4149781 [Trichonephila clavipes]|uniref:Uncharacterized protein n=1 Tax=Trichonephila clavipes TaxID=2585209 RepID=A0A8X7BFJ2_TRICX|nr:hypothetical protein TNCV_4149781 [Trichonephila clavipes]